MKFLGTLYELHGIRIIHSAVLKEDIHELLRLFELLGTHILRTCCRKYPRDKYEEQPREVYRLPVPELMLISVKTVIEDPVDKVLIYVHHLHRRIFVHLVIKRLSTVKPRRDSHGSRRITVHLKDQLFHGFLSKRDFSGSDRRECRDHTTSRLRIIESKYHDILTGHQTSF